MLVLSLTCLSLEPHCFKRKNNLLKTQVGWKWNATRFYFRSYGDSFTQLRKQVSGFYFWVVFFVVFKRSNFKVFADADFIKDLMNHSQSALIVKVETWNSLLYIQVFISCLFQAKLLEKIQNFYTSITKTISN